MLKTLKSHKGIALVLALVLSVSGIAMAIGTTLASQEITWTATLPSGVSTANTVDVKNSDGKGGKLILTVNNAVTWGTSDIGIARVTGSSNGTTTITAYRPGFFAAFRTTSNGLVGSINAAVFDSSMPREYKIAKNSSTIKGAGKTDTVPIIMKDMQGNIITGAIKWASDDVAVATVNESTGLITAVAENGTANINGSFTDCYGQPQVISYHVVVGELKGEFVDAPEKLNVGDVVVPLTAEDEDGKEIPIVNWTSSDPTIIEVAPDGTLTAKKPGEATITGRDVDGNSATCIIEVVDELIVNPVAVMVPAGENVNIPAITNAKGDTVDPKTLTWTNTDTAKATIDTTTGKINGLVMGVVTLTGTDTNGNKAIIQVTVNGLTDMEKLEQALVGDRYNALKNVNEGCSIGDNQNWVIIPYFQNYPEFVNGSNDFGIIEDNYGEIPKSKLLTDSPYASGVTFTGGMPVPDGRLKHADATVWNPERAVFDSSQYIYVWKLPTYSEFMGAGGNDPYHESGKAIYTITAHYGTASKEIEINMYYLGTILYIRDEHGNIVPNPKEYLDWTDDYSNT